LDSFIKEAFRARLQSDWDDNINDYYDVKLKYTRLENLNHSKLLFIKGDISDKDLVMQTFEEYKPNVAVI
jgi:UDP-glucuronate 4-epimerase